MQNIPNAGCFFSGKRKKNTFPTSFNATLLSVDYYPILHHVSELEFIFVADSVSFRNTGDKYLIVRGSVTHPDPYVLGPPGFASGAVSHKYGSGSGSFPPFLIKVFFSKSVERTKIMVAK